MKAFPIVLAMTVLAILFCGSLANDDSGSTADANSNPVADIFSGVVNWAKTAVGKVAATLGVGGSDTAADGAQTAAADKSP